MRLGAQQINTRVQHRERCHRAPRNKKISVSSDPPRAHHIFLYIFKQKIRFHVEWSTAASAHKSPPKMGGNNTKNTQTFRSFFSFLAFSLLIQSEKIFSYFSWKDLTRVIGILIYINGRLKRYKQDLFLYLVSYPVLVLRRRFSQLDDPTISWHGRFENVVVE